MLIICNMCNTVPCTCYTDQKKKKKTSQCLINGTDNYIIL